MTDDAESSDGEYETLNYEITGRGVLAIELDRPHRLNALSARLVEELDGLLTDADPEKDGIRCVTVEGAGDAFSAGGEIDEFLESSQYDVAAVSAGVETLAAFPRPSLAKIDGYCLGGGLELALACDLRVATEDATFGLPEITLGLVPGGGGTQRLPREIGHARAKELIYRGTHIDGGRAERWGLVNRTVESDRFESVVKEFLDDILNGPPLALETAKRLVDDSSEMGLDAGIAAEGKAFGILLGTDDAAEGIEGFQEDREAEFQGQ